MQDDVINVTVISDPTTQYVVPVMAQRGYVIMGSPSSGETNCHRNVITQNTLADQILKCLSVHYFRRSKIMSGLSLGKINSVWGNGMLLFVKRGIHRESE